jgi:hypothetical protein
MPDRCRIPAAIGNLAPLDQLTRGTPGTHQITWIGELRNGASETDEERDAFPASVTESRQAGLARAASAGRRLRY